MGTNATPQLSVLVGANIEAARLAAGLTRSEFAAQVGVKHKDVWRWETGKVEPTAYRQVIADLLFDGDLSAMYAERKAAA